MKSKFSYLVSQIIKSRRMESASIFESVNGCEDEDFAEVALPLAEELVNQLLSSTKV